ncbi:hypothetical protein N7470_000237 [Penicillium chermesinum]|nr:hypothetical protein N7470_000237 [Penicillium chermesinum]
MASSDPAKPPDGEAPSYHPLNDHFDLSLNDSIFEPGLCLGQLVDDGSQNLFNDEDVYSFMPLSVNGTALAPDSLQFGESWSSIEGLSDMQATAHVQNQNQMFTSNYASPLDNWSWRTQPPLDSEVTPSSNLDLQQRPMHSSAGRRGLPRRKSRYLISSEGSTTPVYIPNSSGLDPMQRWQESPPEDEPASMTAIMNAMEETTASHTASDKSKVRSSSAFRNYRRARSFTSGGSSASSTDSAWSSAGTSPRSSKHRPARAAVSKNKKTDVLHLSLETWYCAPLGPSVFSPVTGKEHCVYCNEMEPSQEHLDTHNYRACQNASKEFRSFRRKDHLVQHLRHTHKIQEVPLLDDWKFETKNIPSRCGFCDTILDTWDARIEHLARHFRQGSTMKDWKGDHEFPPAITAQLKNAYPPYLLGWESESILPFSATSSDVRDQYAHVMSKTTLQDEQESTEPASSGPVNRDPTKLEFHNFLAVFTRHLSKYARKQMELGIIPTDEMFQQESRKVLFDSEDAWDQTIADNPDWLSAFSPDAL